jgi:alkylhydroperoxidase family enzyme
MRYCLAAHTYLGKHVAGLDDDEMTSNRAGRSNDARVDAAVRFATIVATERGHVSNAALREVQDAGFDDGEVMEIVAHVALNTLTNYVNEVAQTDVDFPAVDRALAA